jgi:hypothetical protein
MYTRLTGAIACLLGDKSEAAQTYLTILTDVNVTGDELEYTIQVAEQYLGITAQVV